MWARHYEDKLHPVRVIANILTNCSKLGGNRAAASDFLSNPAWLNWIAQLHFQHHTRYNLTHASPLLPGTIHCLSGGLVLQNRQITGLTAAVVSRLASCRHFHILLFTNKIFGSPSWCHIFHYFFSILCYGKVCGDTHLYYRVRVTLI